MRHSPLVYQLAGFLLDGDCELHENREVVRTCIASDPLALKRPILTAVFGQNQPTTALPASILSQVDSTIFVDRQSCPAELQLTTAESGS